MSSTRRREVPRLRIGVEATPAKRTYIDAPAAVFERVLAATRKPELLAADQQLAIETPKQARVRLLFEMKKPLVEQDLAIQEATMRRFAFVIRAFHEGTGYKEKDRFLQASLAHSARDYSFWARLELPEEANLDVISADAESYRYDVAQKLGYLASPIHTHVNLAKDQCEGVGRSGIWIGSRPWHGLVIKNRHPLEFDGIGVGQVLQFGDCNLQSGVAQIISFFTLARVAQGLHSDRTI